MERLPGVRYSAATCWIWPWPWSSVCAFGAVVTALVKDLLTPFIAAVVGKPDFSAIAFTIHGSQFPIGDLINTLVSFLLISAAVYFMVIAPVNAIVARARAARSRRTRRRRPVRSV